MVVVGHDSLPRHPNSLWTFWNRKEVQQIKADLAAQEAENIGAACYKTSMGKR